MNKKLSKFLIVFAFLSIGIIFYSCSKTEVSQQQTAQNLQAELFSSTEYAIFVSATNNIVASLSIQGIKSADLKTSSSLIGNRESFTKTEIFAILKKLQVNPDVYIKSHMDMSIAVKSFQKKYHLTDNENALIWEQTILKHKESFKTQIWFPDIQGFIDCGIASIQEFAATTAVCLALREIPIIGEELYQVCETEAINNLISNLTECLDFILP